MNHHLKFLRCPCSRSGELGPFQPTVIGQKHLENVNRRERSGEADFRRIEGTKNAPLLPHMRQVALAKVELRTPLTFMVRSKSGQGRIAMESLRKWACVVSPVLAAVIILASVPPVPAIAGIVTTDQLVDLQTDATNRERITDFLTRDDVRRQMTDLGVAPADTRFRVAALSDAEAHAVAAKIENAPAGQGTVGALLLTAVVVLMVFIVTDVSGVTDVFPFDNPPSDRPLGEGSNR
jgi:hypothetical protein